MSTTDGGPRTYTCCSSQGILNTKRFLWIQWSTNQVLSGGIQGKWHTSSIWTWLTPSSPSARGIGATVWITTWSRAAIRHNHSFDGRVVIADNRNSAFRSENGVDTDSINRRPLKPPTYWQNQQSFNPSSNATTEFFCLLVHFTDFKPFPNFQRFPRNERITKQVPLSTWQQEHNYPLKKLPEGKHHGNPRRYSLQ